MKLIAYNNNYLYFEIGEMQFTILFIGDNNNVRYLPDSIRRIQSREVLEKEGWLFVEM